MPLRGAAASHSGPGRAAPLGVRTLIVQPQQFNFKYMVIGISALIDGSGGVQVKMGMRKLNTTLQQIKYVYVIRHGDQAEEVLICHETSPEKTKVFRANANLGDPNPGIESVMLNVSVPTGMFAWPWGGGN